MFTYTNVSAQIQAILSVTMEGVKKLSQAVLLANSMGALSAHIKAVIDKII